MDLIERYIFAVVTRLPANRREEVAKDLRGLIEEKLSGRGGAQKPSPGDIEAVLLELGEPSLVADKYRGRKRFLIGPEYFDLYLLVLKIVVAAVAFGLTLAMVIGYMVNPPQQWWGAIGSYITSLLAAIAQVFAWITVLFAAFEYYGVRLSDLSREKKWEPSRLPPVPAKTALIKPVEPILTIVFTVLVIILFNAAEHIVGLYISGPDAGVTVVPLFNRKIFSTFLPFFNVLFILAIVKECLKLVFGKWTIALAVVNGVLNVAFLVLFITAFTNPGIWNGDLFLYLIREGVLPADNMEMIWNISVRIFLAVFTFALVVDTVASLGKALKHRATDSL